MQYPARITLTYDDPGLINGSHQYIQSLLPTFQAKNAPLSIAVVTGYDLSAQLIPTFQSWINAGWDVNCHSVSHQYFVFQRVHDSVHGHRCNKRDALDCEQAAHHHSPGRPERTGDLGLELLRKRLGAERVRHDWRPDFHPEST